MTNLERRKLTSVTSITMLYAAVLLAILRVGASQDVTVDVPFVSAYNGTQATLRCSYSITGSGYDLVNVQWSFGEGAATAVVIAFFVVGATSPTYAGDFGEPAYTMTRTDALSQLVIAESIYEKDKGTYWCRVEYSKALEVPSERMSGALDINVLPSKVTLSNETHELSAGDTVNLPAEHVVKFFCMVDDVKPKANFTWEYGSEELQGKPDHELKSNGLFVSKSSVDLTAKVGEITLTCTAVNKPGHEGTSVSVLLDVGNPCDDDSYCDNGGTCTLENNKAECKCRGGFSGVRCETGGAGRLSTSATILIVAAAFFI